MANPLNLSRPGAPLANPVVDASGLMTGPWKLFAATVGDVTSLGPTLSDTHANRINSVPNTMPYYGPGKFWRYQFYETDRNSLYVSELVNNVASWLWIAGTMSGATLANLPGDLGINDTGFLFWDNQFSHLYRWNGTIWTFAPGDPGAGWCAPSGLNGGTPFSESGSAWHLCDGSTIPISKGDGTTTNITIPNLGTGAFVYGAAAQTAVTAASSPTWAAGAKTDDESAHTHPVTQVSNVPTTGAQTVDTGNPTGAGSAHHHTLSNANAVINPPSLANGGLPINIGLVWYIRR